jgi:hypothetical protein
MLAVMPCTPIPGKRILAPTCLRSCWEACSGMPCWAGGGADPVAGLAMVPIIAKKG